MATRGGGGGTGASRGGRNVSDEDRIMRDFSRGRINAATARERFEDLGYNFGRGTGNSFSVRTGGQSRRRSRRRRNG